MQGNLVEIEEHAKNERIMIALEKQRREICIKPDKSCCTG